MTVQQSDMKLDGNAIGGLLREIFTMEMTNAEGTCASCGKVSVVGQVVVYLNAPGAVVRCPTASEASSSRASKTHTRFQAFLEVHARPCVI